MDGKLYIGTEKRTLWILKTGRRKQIVRPIALPHAMYNTPVVANGVMCIAIERRLYAIRKKKPGAP